jgi:hypothetical protein
MRRRGLRGYPARFEAHTAEELTITRLQPGTIQVLARTPEVLGALTFGLSETLVDSHADGEWSARDVVAHILDRWPSQQPGAPRGEAAALPLEWHE